MLTIKDGNIKQNTNKYAVGFDLCNSSSQISFLDYTGTEPVTVSVVMGTELFNIPTVLAKRPGVGQWFFGREAIKYVNESKGILVDNLLDKAIYGEEIIVDNEAYDPVALLSLFVKRCLTLLGMHISIKNVDSFMITVPNLSHRMVEVLEKTMAYLSLGVKNISFQSHLDSFYSYMIHQPRELWNYQVLALDYNDSLSSMRFECSTKTTPEVVLIHNEHFDSLEKTEWPVDEEEREAKEREMDEVFFRIISELLPKGDISTVYLLGDGFKDPWPRESLKLLCKNRRVFQGNNLYSKGACYSMLDKIEPSEIAKSHVYLGEDKVKSNVGIRAIKQGVVNYIPVIDAGKNYFETTADLDLYIENGDELTFVVTSLTGGNMVDRSIKLDGLVERPNFTTRLRIHIEMNRVDCLEISIEDLGFGEIFKSSGRAWQQTLVL